MEKYHFKLNCGESVLNGVHVSVTATSELQASIKVAESIGHLKLTSLELLGKGPMTAAQLMGAAGGKKSKRNISPEEQIKMQAARTKAPRRKKIK